ncbi:hypothetical protein [Streptomyces sp. NPDC002851]
MIARDPDVSDEARRSVALCTEGCGLRSPAWRDVTGDGKPELIVLIDADPRIEAKKNEYGEPLGSELYVYRVDEGRVFQILGMAVDAGTTVETLGHNLVLRTVSKQAWNRTTDQITTDRYRWEPHVGVLELVASAIAPAPANRVTPDATTPRKQR